MNSTQKPTLKPSIEQLSKRANVCGLADQEKIPIEAREIIGRADKEKRLLSKNELSRVCAQCRSSELAVDLMMRKSAESIKHARGYLLERQPQLILPGGKLYPEHRAQACWRDCEQFMRVVLYGIACNCDEVTDKAGMMGLSELYHFLGVPVSALLCLLEELKEINIKILKESGYTKEVARLSKIFEDLLNALKPIRVQPSKADYPAETKRMPSHL